jgi:ribosome maturation factor RimP
MTDTDLAARLTGLLEPKAVDAGFELVCVEVAGPVRTPIVRVYLDREDGIDIEAITAANVWVKDALDAYPDTSAGYNLEVSSPGIERPLVKRQHFERFAGSKAKITTREPVDGRKSFTGTITTVEDDAVIMDLDGTTHTIPLGVIDKARLRVEIDFNKEGLDGI